MGGRCWNVVSHFVGTTVEEARPSWKERMVIRQQGDGGTEKQQMVQEICSCLANVIWW